MADDRKKQQVFPRKEKYFISPNTTFWSVGLCIFAGIVYAGLLIAINSYTGTVPYGYYVARDIFLVIFTILLTTLLTARMIEVRGKNELYEDAILNDVVANPAFYKAFEDPVKRAMLARLEQELVFGDSADVQAMYSSIKEKLARVTAEKYYFSACSYRVKCTIADGIITKYINRTVKLRSFRPQDSIADFLALNWSGLGDIDGFFSLKSITDESGNPRPFRNEGSSPPSAAESDSFCGYTINHKYKLSQPLPIFADRDTTVSITYTTRVPLSDNIYICRSSVPCKHFSVDVRLDNSPDFKLNTAAFGFFDTGVKASLQNDDSEVRLEFNDWVFNKDGVCVVFAPRTEESLPPPLPEEKPRAARKTAAAASH